MGWVSFLYTEDEDTDKLKKSYSVLFGQSRWFSQCQGDVQSIYRKTQLSYYPNRCWFQWMFFYLSKDFLKTGLPSNWPSRCRGAAPGRGESFPQLVLESRQICAVDFCLSASKVPCEMNVRCEVLFICTIYLHWEGSRQISLLQKSSLLVLQSVTKNVLINGDFLI